MRKLLAFIATVAGLAIGVPTTSSAGGWVVVSLDSMPAVHAGDDTEIGFTVLRHGVTPESSDDLAIVLTGPDGTSHRSTRCSKAPSATTSPRSRCRTRVTIAGT